MSAPLSANLRRTAAAVAGVAAVCLASGLTSAQQVDDHVSSVVDRLSRGERVFGVSTYDLSLENARSLARSDIDYVYVDMEHGAMDFAALQTFLLAMTDKAAIHRSGSLRQNVTRPGSGGSRPASTYGTPTSGLSIPPVTCWPS